MRTIGAVLLGAACAAVLAAAPAGAVERSYTAAAGGVDARLDVTVRAPSGSPPGITALSLAITRTGGETTLLTSADMRWEVPAGNVLEGPRPLRVADLDRDGEPEVLLDTFWGGAHCCFQTRIFRFDAGTGRYVRLTSTWGDAPARLRGLGGATPEFLGVDGRFAYALGDPYAASRFPVRTWAYRRGVLVVTTRTHPALVRRDRAAQWRAYTRFRRLGLPRSTALAAYLADSLVLGDARAGWARARRAESGNPRRLRAIAAQLHRWGYR